MGELIDRYALKCSISNPELAVSVVKDYLGIVIGHQSEEFAKQVVFGLMEFCLHIVTGSEEYKIEEILKKIDDEQSRLRKK